MHYKNRVLVTCRLNRDLYRRLRGPGDRRPEVPIGVQIEQAFRDRDALLKALGTNTALLALYESYRSRAP